MSVLKSGMMIEKIEGISHMNYETLHCEVGEAYVTTSDQDIKEGCKELIYAPKGAYREPEPCELTFTQIGDWRAGIMVALEDKTELKYLKMERREFLFDGYNLYELVR